MYTNKKFAVAALSVMTALTIGIFTASAEPFDTDLTDNPSYSESEVYDDPGSSSETYIPPESSSSYYDPDDSYSSYDTSGDYYDSSDSNDSYYSDDYSTDDYYSDEYDSYYESQNPDYYSSDYGTVTDREQEYYESGTMGEDSTQPVLDNKMYDVSSEISSDEMQADDWDIALDLEDSGGGNDFNFIKDNDSTDDSVWYQMILFGGILLITVAVFGVFMIIIMTARAHKRNKARARAQRRKPSPGLRFETEYTKRDREYKFDTAEIDLSKYDKYM